MDGRKLGGIVLVVVVIGFGAYARMKNRVDTSNDLQEAVMSWIVDMPSYGDHGDALDIMADYAHQLAFDEAYSSGGRRRAARLDDEAYVEKFFGVMIEDAERRNLSDVVEDLQECREMCLEAVREG